MVHVLYGKSKYRTARYRINGRGWCIPYRKIRVRIGWIERDGACTIGR